MQSYFWIIYGLYWNNLNMKHVKYFEIRTKLAPRLLCMRTEVVERGAQGTTDTCCFNTKTCQPSIPYGIKRHLFMRIIHQTQKALSALHFSFSHDPCVELTKSPWSYQPQLEIEYKDNQSSPTLKENTRILFVFLVLLINEHPQPFSALEMFPYQWPSCLFPAAPTNASNPPSSGAWSTPSAFSEAGRRISKLFHDRKMLQWSLFRKSFAIASPENQVPEMILKGGVEREVQRMW